MMVLEIAGIWLLVVIVLSFFFGMKGLIQDPDWGVFIAVLTAAWPLVLLGVAIILLSIIPCGIIYLLTISIANLGKRTASKLTRRS